MAAPDFLIIDNKNFYSFAGYTSPSRSNIDNKTNDPIVFLKEIDEG